MSTESTRLILGLRTFISGLVGVTALTFGLWMIPAVHRSDAFFAFAGGIVGIMGTIAGKSAVDSLAQGNGVKGALHALMTDAKPGSPPPPAKVEPPKPPQENG